MRTDYLVHDPGDTVFVSAVIDSVTIDRDKNVTYDVIIGDSRFNLKPCDIYLPHLDAATKTVLMDKDYKFGYGRYE